MDGSLRQWCGNNKSERASLSALSLLEVGCRQVRIHLIFV